MQPLATIRRSMMWLSMCPPDASASARQKKAYVYATFAVFALNVIGCIAPMVFCMKCISINFNGATFAFMITIAELGVIYFMIVAILMRHQIEGIFTSLTTIYKSSKFIQ